MKQYHTSIEISASVEQVWQILTDFEKYVEWNPLISHLKGRFAEGEMIRVFIKPLKEELPAKLIKVIDNQEFIWLGLRFAYFLLNATHYYKLEKIGENHTRLLHGEVFKGWFSHFLPTKLLKQMEAVFNEHNQKLKTRLESEN